MNVSYQRELLFCRHMVLARVYLQLKNVNGIIEANIYGYMLY